MLRSSSGIREARKEKRLIPKFGDSVKLTATGNPLIGKNAPNSGSGGSSPSGSNGTSPSGNPAGMGSSGTSILPGMIASIVIAVIIFLVVMLLVSIKCYVSRRHRRPTISLKIEVAGNPESRSTSVRNIEITIEVLKQATNNFNEDNILGRGGFGVVYKGEYHDGTKVAVKRMESAAMGSKGINEFQAEISVLNKVADFGLVKIAPDGKNSVWTRLAGTFGYLATEYGGN
uniref:Protein kinase domain-containing protein n=1 Tax=Quercus lobata TaxID=97700 RepID=A0A7N2M8W7_QUELO